MRANRESMASKPEYLFAAYSHDDVESERQAEQPAWLTASSFSHHDPAEGAPLEEPGDADTGAKKRKKHKKASRSHSKKNKAVDLTNDYGRPSSSPAESSSRQALMQRAEANLRRRATHGEVTWQIDSRGNKANLQYYRYGSHRRHCPEALTGSRASIYRKELPKMPFIGTAWVIGLSKRHPLRTTDKPEPR